MIRSPHPMTHAQHFARGPVHRSDWLFQAVEMVKPAMPERMPLPAVTDSTWSDYDAASGEDEPTFHIITGSQDAAD